MRRLHLFSNALIRLSGALPDQLAIPHELVPPLLALTLLVDHPLFLSPASFRLPFGRPGPATACFRCATFSIPRNLATMRAHDAFCLKCCPLAGFPQSGQGRGLSPAPLSCVSVILPPPLLRPSESRRRHEKS